MIICPVCRNKITKGCICSECGHDESRNVENHLSLVKLSENRKTLSAEIEAYQSRENEKKLRRFMKKQLDSYELRMNNLEKQVSERIDGYEPQLKQLKKEISEQKESYEPRLKQLEAQVSEQKKQFEELEQRRLVKEIDQSLSEKGNFTENELEHMRKLYGKVSFVSRNKEAERTDIPVQEERWQKGGYVTFGRYFINDRDHREPIEWLVLSEDKGTYLLLSRYGLDIKKYNDTYQNTTWGYSDIRKWMNKIFHQNAFSNLEKENIISQETSDKKRIFPFLESTQDVVFLLSKEEARLYLANNDARKAKPTRFARESGFKIEFGASEYGKWWLRSQGNLGTDAAFVDVNGGVNDSGMDIRTDGVMVRPAIWVEHKE